MKLLIAADIFPPESGGPATYAVTLANELVKQGVEVKIVSLNSNSDASKVACPVYSVKSSFKPLRYWQYYKLLLQQGRDADVIYAMGPVNAGLPALRAARKLGKKFVVKVVGDYAWEQARVKGLTKDSVDDFQTRSYRGKICLLKKIEQHVVCHADVIITPCAYLKNMVVGWGAQAAKIIVIYNAVEFDDVAPVAKPAGQRWVVMAARLTPWKGARALISAVVELHVTMPDVRLKIIGSGPELVRLKSYVQENKISTTVELLGNLARTQALAYIKAADVFVLNSGYEGLSHVLLEALYLGTPVLASRIGGNPEVVGPDQLFKFNHVEQIKNKIQVVLEKKLLATARPAGIITQEVISMSFVSFSLKTMISKTKACLQSVTK